MSEFEDQLRRTERTNFTIRSRGHCREPSMPPPSGRHSPGEIIVMTILRKSVDLSSSFPWQDDVSGRKLLLQTQRSEASLPKPRVGRRDDRCRLIKPKFRREIWKCKRESALLGTASFTQRLISSEPQTPASHHKTNPRATRCAPRARDLHTQPDHGEAMTSIALAPSNISKQVARARRMRIQAAASGCSLRVALLRSHRSTESGTQQRDERRNRRENPTGRLTNVEQLSGKSQRIEVRLGHTDGAAGWRRVAHCDSAGKNPGRKKTSAT